MDGCLMSGGTQYIDRFVLNGVEVFTVSSDPNGSLTAPKGSVAFRVDAGSSNLEYRNTSGSATGNTWAAGGGGGSSGPTWTRLALSHFSASSDISTNLTGAVSESGGAITWPLKSADQTQNIRSMSLHTMTMAALATLTGVTTASLTDGTNLILVHIVTTSIPRNSAIGVVMMDRALASQAAAYGGGVSLTRLVAAESIGAGWIKSGSRTQNGTAPLADDPWVVGELHAFNDTGNRITMVASIYEVGDASAAIQESAAFSEEADGSMNALTYFGIGSMFMSTASGSAGNLTGTIHVAAVNATDHYFKTLS